MDGPDEMRPDAEETHDQRARYSQAQESFSDHRARIETSYNTFRYSREQFHQIEGEFLSLLEEMRRTDDEQIRNLSHLEGLRIRLLTSLDGPYRHSVNELADAMLDSIGMPPRHTPADDGASA